MSNLWSDVPDPRPDDAPCSRVCQVEVSVNVWRKIATKHATGMKDPAEKVLWGEWLDEPRPGRFCGLWELDVSDADRTATLTRVSGIVENAAKRCLGVPLAVVYGEFPRPPAKGNPRDAWSLVLPSGALLAVHSTLAGGEVRSCYFKSAVCRARLPTNRWRVLAELLTLTYAERSPAGTWVPKEMAVRDDTTIVGIRFRTAASWRLDRNHSAPWELIPDPYHPPTAAAPRKLRPRQPC